MTSDNQAKKPKVTIYATGGTIAGGASSNTDTLHYDAGSIGIDSLLDAVPKIHEFADVSGIQFRNVGSHAITSADLVELSQRINQQFAEGSANGVVITHGTDTLEETAFFMELTINQPSPVVMVGAMRPATALSADGPLNLLQATALAASPDARDRGTLIVLNDRIQPGFYTTKTNANSLDTFRASEPGALGVFLGERPHFYYPPARPNGLLHFDISRLDKPLPRVDILYSHQDASDDLLHHAIDQGAKGVVIAASGAGHHSPALEDAAKELTAQGYPVILSSRTGAGFAVRTENFGISSGQLNPQKSRILLMLALGTGCDYDQIRAHFNTAGGAMTGAA